MPQHRIDERKVGRVALMRAAAGAVLVVLVASANTSTALAEDDDDVPFVTKVLRTLGVKRSGDPYDGVHYNERSPLVVPPSRDLPPPASTALPPAPNWPVDQDIKQRAEAKVKKSRNARSTGPNRPDRCVPKSLTR